MPGFLFMKENLFSIPDKLNKEFENFISLLDDEKILIEKIISNGQKTPENQWLEQERNEWVVLIQGEAEIRFDDGEVKILKSGDYINILSNKKHRVEKTSTDPVCIWLAVHY